MKRLILPLAALTATVAVAAAEWTDISAAVAAREAAVRPSGDAVGTKVWAGPFKPGDAGLSEAEYVTDERPFDSLTWLEFVFPMAKFYSTPQPGGVLILR